MFFFLSLMKIWGLQWRLLMSVMNFGYEGKVWEIFTFPQAGSGILSYHWNLKCVCCHCHLLMFILPLMCLSFHKAFLLTCWHVHLFFRYFGEITNSPFHFLIRPEHILFNYKTILYTLKHMKHFWNFVFYITIVMQTFFIWITSLKKYVMSIQYI